MGLSHGSLNPNPFSKTEAATSACSFLSKAPRYEGLLASAVTAYQLHAVEGFGSIPLHKPLHKRV